MKKLEFRELVDQNLSGLVWDEAKRRTVLQAVRKEEKPVKKLSATFILMAAIVCLSVTALAAGLVFSSRVDASRLAEKAVADTYGVTEPMLSTFFSRTVTETADGGMTVAYSGIDFLNEVLGTYTVAVKDGAAAALWSHDGESTSGLFDAEAWGKEQLEEMLRTAAERHDLSAFSEKAKAIAAKHKAASGELPEGSAWEKTGEAEALAAAKASSYSEEDLLALAKDAVVSVYQLTDDQAKMLKFVFELEDMADYTADYLYYHLKDGKPVLTIMLSLQQRPADNSSAFPPFTPGDGVYWVDVNVETGTIEDLLYDSLLGGNG